MSDIIEVEDLFRIYKTKKTEVVALRGLDVRIKKGELIAIMGPSGCGKTTLLNIIGGLDRPSAGRISIDGKSMMDMNDAQLIQHRRDTVGFVFQFFNLVPVLTAYENVELPLRLTSADTPKDRVQKTLELVGMENRAHHRSDEMSGGEQQRIAIATALVNDPPIILADEPTGELDSKTGQDILELFKRLNKEVGKTIIIVTHDRRVSSIADRMLYIEDGKIVSSTSREMTVEPGAHAHATIDEEAIRHRLKSEIMEELAEKIKQM